MKLAPDIQTTRDDTGHARAGAVAAHPFVARLLEVGRTRGGPETVVAEAPLPPPETARRSAVSLADLNPPPLPQVFSALRRATQNPCSTTAEVAGVLSMDPSLASYVLRLANSALYAPPDRVDTVSRAVARIGLAEIETMAAAALVGRLFEKPPRPDVLSLSDFWRHAVAVAMLSRALAGRVAKGLGERTFVAGLLHDLGRLMLALAEPDLAAAVLSGARAGNLAMHEAERAALGFDHADLGGRVCLKWRLPEALAEAVAGHHAPSRCPDSVQAAAVHLADFMANVLGHRIAPAAALAWPEAATLGAFGLEDADPLEFLGILEEGLATMTALFAP